MQASNNNSNMGAAGAAFNDIKPRTRAERVMTQKLNKHPQSICALFE